MSVTLTVLKLVELLIANRGIIVFVIGSTVFDQFDSGLTEKLSESPFVQQLKPSEKNWQSPIIGFKDNGGYLEETQFGETGCVLICMSSEDWQAELVREGIFSIFILLFI